MKRPLLLLFSVILAAALSCSKPAPPPKQPTPVPIVFQMDTPTEVQTPEPLEYVIEDLKGTVLIIENGSTQPEPAQEEETVEEGDEIITKSGSQVSLTLDDNTLFQLYENSDIKVDQLKPNASKGFISRLKLAEGRILSEVEKLKESDSTFDVTSGGVVCGVRGTAFEVQNQGQVVHTSTFHGIVEMKKGDQVQQVGENRHLAFSLKKGGFLPLRALNPQERQHYKNWQRRMPTLQRRRAQRMEVLRSMASLPPEQRRQVLQNLRAVKPKDRMRAMHQMLRERSMPNHAPEQKPGVLNGTKPAERPQHRQGQASQGKRSNGGKVDHRPGRSQGPNNRVQKNGLKNRGGKQSRPQNRPKPKPQPQRPNQHLDRSKQRPGQPQNRQKAKPQKPNSPGKKKDNKKKPKDKK